MPGPRPFLPPGSATIDDFRRLDLRVGRIVAARTFPEARKPAYQLDIDFGPGGMRRSSAQLPGTYPDPAALVGRLVVCVVNFPPRRDRGLHERGPGARRRCQRTAASRCWASTRAPSRVTPSAEHDPGTAATQRPRTILPGSMPDGGCGSPDGALTYAARVAQRTPRRPAGAHRPAAVRAASGFRTTGHKPPLWSGSDDRRAGCAGGRGQER